MTTEERLKDKIYNWDEADRKADWTDSRGCCNQEDSRREAWLNELQLCGCADNESVAGLAIKLLEDFEAEKDYASRCVNFETQPELYYLLAERLDNSGFIEHGTSSRFPWLTDFGREWLAHKFLLEEKKLIGRSDFFKALSVFAKEKQTAAGMTLTPGLVLSEWLLESANDFWKELCK